MGEDRIAAYSFKTQLHIPLGPSVLAGFNDLNLAQTDRGVGSLCLKAGVPQGSPCLISLSPTSYPGSFHSSESRSGKSLGTRLL